MLPVWIAVAALIVSPAIAPEALIVVAPAIAPAAVMPLPFKLRAPVMEAPPAETVKPLAAVIEPLPVVMILPLVVKLPALLTAPNSLMLNLEMPPDLISIAVLVLLPLVSLTTKEVPVPALVRLTDVWVPRPAPKVKEILLPSVVVMVLPLS